MHIAKESTQNYHRVKHTQNVEIDEFAIDPHHDLNYYTVKDQREEIKFVIKIVEHFYVGFGPYFFMSSQRVRRIVRINQTFTRVITIVKISLIFPPIIHIFLFILLNFLI